MAEPGEPLSEREQAVLEGLADGLTNREIAQNLSISPNTVKVHVRNIFTKLDVSSRTEATTAGIQKGLLAVPGSVPDSEPVEIEEGPAQPAAEETLPVHSPAVQSPAVRSDDSPSDDSPSDDSPSNERALIDEPAAYQPPADKSAAPGAGRSWRLVAFILILVLGLIVGALASAWFFGNGADPTPASPDETEVEQFEVQPLGDSNWRTGRPLPTERADMAVASIGLDLYVIGGQVEAGVVNLVDVYETDGHRWSSAASKPTAVSDSSAAVLFGEIYVPGGRLADDRPTAVVEAYSPANNAWRPVEPLPAPVAGGLALSDGNRLYLLGGWDGERYLDGGFVYDPAADVWDTLPPMTHARADAAGDVVGDHLFVIGGYDGRSELDACEYFDVAEGAWSGCASLDLPRAGAGASAQGNDSLYVIGGGKEGAVTSAELYDLFDDSWSPVEMPMLGDTDSWYDLGVVAVETHIYTLGGRQGETILADNYTYIPFVHRTYLPSIGSDG